jgi:pilus assembly protein CpaE
MADGRIKALLAAFGNIDTETLNRAVAEQPDLTVVGLIESGAAWTSRGFDADVLLVACEGPQPDVLSLIEQETAAQPDLPVVVLCGGSPNGFVRQVFEAGADDIVASDDFASVGPQVSFALRKALTRKASPHVPSAREEGALVCVLGPKGGTGKTLTAANTAVALSLEGKRVALIDLDLQFGDLGLVLGIKPERSIYDLVVAGGTLDPEKIDAFLSRHASGVRVLLAPPRPDHASAVTPEFLRDLYAVMRAEFDYVIVDTPPGFTPEVIATVDAASEVCLIGTLDTPSLKNGKLGVETLELMGYPMDAVRVVLNRADSSVGVSHADVVSVLGRAPDVLVPSNREIVRSVNAGEPIVMSSPRSEASKAFRALARLLMNANEVPVPAKRSRGLRILSRA